MIESLVAILSEEAGLSAEEVADALWLAAIRYQRTKPPIASGAEFPDKVTRYEGDTPSLAAPVEELTNTVLKSQSKLDLPPRAVSQQMPEVESLGIVFKRERSVSSATSPFERPFKFPSPPVFRNLCRL